MFGTVKRFSVIVPTYDVVAQSTDWFFVRDNQASLGESWNASSAPSMHQMFSLT